MGRDSTGYRTEILWAASLAVESMIQTISIDWGSRPSPLVVLVTSVRKLHGPTKLYLSSLDDPLFPQAKVSIRK
jgi:hypothetical protein